MLNAQIIEGFVESLLKRNFADAAGTPECHREWWDMCCSNQKFVALAAPRGHAKSTAITFAFTLAAVLFRERKFVILVSDTEAQSTLFLGSIKRELTENEDLRALFAISDVSTWDKETESDIIISFEDGHKARIIAKGAEQKLRGLNWAGTRPDLIIGDDMENDEIVLNKDRREKFKRWFTGALLPSLSKNGVIRIVGTILHMDSLLENFMPKIWDKQYPPSMITDLKIISDPHAYWYAAKYRAHPGMNDFSSLLWPQYRDVAWLKKEQGVYKAQNLGDVYAQEYLNEPIDDSNSLFRKSDFPAMSLDEKTQNVNSYISMDLAVTKDNVKRDYTVFTRAGITSENRLQVRQVDRARMDTLEIVDKIIELQRDHKPMFFICEKGAITNSILPFLRVKMQETQVYPIIHLVGNRVDKIQHTASIRGRMRAGMVKFDKEADWYMELEQECIRFPRDKHDDQVDTLSLLGDALDKFIEAATPAEQMEQAYEDEKEASGFFDQGRSEITGY